MSARRTLTAAAVALLTTLLLAGCGGGSSADPRAASGSGSPSPSETSGPSPTDSMPVEPAPPKVTGLQQPQAALTIKPSATLSVVPGASELPAHGFRTVQGFPVPPGVKIKDPGPLEDTWQFDIRSQNLDSVIAFYKRVLPQMGFTVRLDVTYQLGDEQVHWDIAFDGRISGTMVRDPSNGVVFVVVNPPGQKAIAGEK